MQMRLGFEIRSTLSTTIPIVTIDWLLDCVRQRRLMLVHDYLYPIDGNASAIRNSTHNRTIGEITVGRGIAITCPARGDIDKHGLIHIVYQKCAALDEAPADAVIDPAIALNLDDSMDEMDERILDGLSFRITGIKEEMAMCICAMIEKFGGERAQITPGRDGINMFSICSPRACPCIKWRILQVVSSRIRP